MRKYTIEFCKVFAAGNQWECLSNSYSSKSKMTWRCCKGHIWDALWSNIYHKNSGCPFCAGLKASIDDLDQIAKSKGGQCITREYKNAREPMKFRCEYGHEWETSANGIRSGSWCNDPDCVSRAIINAQTKYTIKHMHEIAEKNGGKCLSLEYTPHNEMIWQCSLGHIWKTRPYHIIHNHSWCHSCAKEKQGNRKYTLDDLRNACSDRGFILLENKYIGTGHKVKVQCSMGHLWDVVADSILHKKSGCPYCSKYVNQEKCRFILEKLTGQKWSITNKIIYPYQLDMYCEEYKIAFEYNGEQHYKEVRKFFHKNRNLRDQQNRDEQKVRLCFEKSITLLFIPYWQAKDDLKLTDFIKENLVKHGISLKYINIEDINDFYNQYSYCRLQLSQLDQIVEANGGKIISNCYKNSTTKIEVECSKGHRWCISPSKIKCGRWCPNCANIQHGIRLNAAKISKKNSQTR